MITLLGGGVFCLDRWLIPEGGESSIGGGGVMEYIGKPINTKKRIGQGDVACCFFLAVVLGLGLALGLGGLWGLGGGVASERARACGV